jgi:capsular exopolysaccharide synthesis family protein
MDLRAYLDILRRRGWIIIVVAVIAALGTFGVSKLQTKIYRATARISAVPARPDWGLGQQAKDLLRNFVNNIKTIDMANQVIAAAQFDLNPYDLLAKVTVSAEPDNFIIRIDADDQDPQVAAKIARTMADIFVNERTAYYNTQDKANRIEVKLVDSQIDAPLYKPKPTTNALAGGVLGALIGLLIILGLEWMSADILATPADVERVLGLPVSGTIPSLAGMNPGAEEKSNKNMNPSATKTNLVSISDPASPAAEAFRRLRTNLASTNNGAPLRTLLVVPAALDREKASTAANLAVAFARIGKQVILADCDLRHPEQHTIFGLSNREGISSAVAQPSARLPLQSTDLPCLRVLTSGPAVEAPADLVGSTSMAGLIARLREESDLVIFDAPPVGMATDAAELASQVDGVLLTVCAGQTKREDAQQAKELLNKVGARLVGVTLVNVPLDAKLRKYLAA